MGLHGAVVCLAEGCLGVHAVMIGEETTEAVALNWLEFARKSHVLTMQHDDGSVLIMIGKENQIALAVEKYGVKEERLLGVNAALSV
ncbi:MAG: hypothetical protein UY27_C0005G0014 [Candidatus Gottesmanbacteria bacterium GW2011_GWA1_48_13]|uniref:Uncharacterized protein n=1 Tax=Candidatus Gottesmanbacteria bacterium GW2011_GWA1_48_13 TaxID=1618439 RepID=A0A0G1UP85_9BACT|nr:MAG: hypothetical protein UY27_C0005G0014 [Candidatus Gottesmanbacteria bacterium GW2011_GWA1_48_13]